MKVKYEIEKRSGKKKMGEMDIPIKNTDIDLEKQLVGVLCLLPYHALRHIWSFKNA